MQTTESAGERVVALDLGRRGARFDRAYPTRDFIRRHFLFLFHDSTFECLARELRLTVSKEKWSAIVERCVARVSAE